MANAALVLLLRGHCHPFNINLWGIMTSQILNPYLDIVKARRQYRDFSWARLEDVFVSTFAESVIQDLVKKTTLDSVFEIDGERVTLSEQQLASLDEDKRNVLFAQIQATAALGKGFFYSSKTVTSETINNELHASFRVLKWLNHEETIELISDISGVRGLTYATCEATRYSKGQFLTSVKPGVNQSLVFTIDLTPQWDSNWGGLLHLHDVYDGAGITFTPKFNNMILFDANQEFSITYLANYIKYNRFALLGYFCTD